MINIKAFNLILALIPYAIIGSASTFHMVKASGTIYIMSDGSVYPSDAPISTIDKITYVFTSNINTSIVIERSNIVVDGNWHSVEGFIGGYGFSLSKVNNVTIRNMEIESFEAGILFHESFGNVISDCNVANNSFGIELDLSSKNVIFQCNITNNYCGIEFDSSIDNIVLNCKIEDNEYGFWLSNCSNNVISECNIADAGCGIGLFESINNTVSGCSFTGNKCSIWLSKSFSNVISGCHIAENEAGIELHESSNNLLKDNILLNNEFNFGIFGVNLQDFVNNVDFSNAVDGKPIYYIINEKDKEIPSNAGYVALVNCTNIGVKNLNLTKNWQGMLLAFTVNSTVSRSIVTGNGCGISLYKSSKNIFLECNITANSKSGIEFDSSHDNAIFNCKMEDNVYGVRLRESFGNVISDCNVANNSFGIEFESSSDNVLTKCCISNNGYGIKIGYSSRNIISWCEITDNGYGAKLDFSSKNMVSNCVLTSNNDGIWLHGSSGNIISENNVTNNGCGIGLYESSQNIICQNDIAANKGSGGIWLHISSENLICRNIILANNKWGMRLYMSSNNTIHECHVRNNEYGIWLYGSQNNSFYYNNFIENVKHLTIEGYGNANFWDNGYPSGGNYWSNYTVEDIRSGPDQNLFGSDGIGDMPYFFAENNVDKYPLMGPIYIFEAGIWNGASFEFLVVSNSTISDFYFRPVEGAFVKYSVSVEKGTNGFCRVSVPNYLLWAENEEWKVFINNEKVSPAIIMTENFTFLYFTYTYDAKTIIIQGTHVIPEFSSSMIQRLFLLFSATVIILLKMKVFKYIRTKE
jgi:parallel beta-helix repeat protein